MLKMQRDKNRSIDFPKFLVNDQQAIKTRYRVQKSQIRSSTAKNLSCHFKDNLVFKSIERI